MHRQIFAESSRDLGVRGTDINLRVAELQLAGALIVVDGERAGNRNTARSPRFQIQHRAGGDSPQPRGRDLPVQLHRTAERPVERTGFPRSQTAHFGDGDPARCRLSR